MNNYWIFFFYYSTTLCVCFMINCQITTNLICYFYGEYLPLNILVILIFLCLSGLTFSSLIQLGISNEFQAGLISFYYLTSRLFTCQERKVSHRTTNLSQTIRIPHLNFVAVHVITIPKIMGMEPLAPSRALTYINVTASVVQSTLLLFLLNFDFLLSLIYFLLHEILQTLHFLV